MPRDLTYERELAIDHAVTLNTARYANGREAIRAVLRDATEIFDWLIGPVALSLAFGPVLDQGTKQPTGTTTGGSPMQLHDTEQIDLTVTATDVKGATVPDDPGTTADDLTWSVDDQNVATLNVSGDTRTCTVIAGMPGSTVGTVSLGGLSATFAVDVIPSGVTALTINEGTPVPQP